MKTAAKLYRSGRTNPFGKCDAELKVKIDSATLAEIAREASELGLPVSEYMRISIYLHRGEKEALLASYEYLLTAIERKGKESALSQRHHRPLCCDEEDDDKGFSPSSRSLTRSRREK